MRRAIAISSFLIVCSPLDPASADSEVAHFGVAAAPADTSPHTSGPWLASPARVLAGPDPGEPSLAEEASPAGEAEAEATQREAETTAQSDAADSPWAEQDNEDYRFVGLRARMIYIPTFMFGLFQADGGTSVLAPSIGPEYVTRRNGFEVDTWLTYTRYGMDEAPFKAKSDPDVAYEIVRSELSVLTVGADFLWTHPLNDKGWSLMYGGGAGIGLVFGDLYRTQAYPQDGQPGDPEDYVPCAGPNTGPGDYCADDNNHYGDYKEPNWLDGGSKPLLFPWIALPQVGLRWKPSRHFVLRVDTGLSFPGPFFFGVSGQYGLL